MTKNKKALADYGIEAEYVSISLVWPRALNMSRDTEMTVDITSCSLLFTHWHCQFTSFGPDTMAFDCTTLLNKI